MGSRSVKKTHNRNLKDPIVAAEYINHALESDDTAIILLAIRNVVDAQEEGLSGIAAKSQLGRESMYKMLSSKGNPKLSTLTALFHGLGLKIVVQPESFENYNQTKKLNLKPTNLDSSSSFV